MVASYAFDAESRNVLKLPNKERFFHVSVPTRIPKYIARRDFRTKQGERCTSIIWIHTEKILLKILSPKSLLRINLMSSEEVHPKHEWPTTFSAEEILLESLLDLLLSIEKLPTDQSESLNRCLRDCGNFGN